MALVSRTQRGRRDVVTAPPDLRLRLPVLRLRFRLVQSLERAVVALVQAPALDHRNPELIELVQSDAQRENRALEHRGVGAIEDEAALAEQPARLARLGAALI